MSNYKTSNVTKGRKTVQQYMKNSRGQNEILVNCVIEEEEIAEMKVEKQYNSI